MTENVFTGTLSLNEAKITLENISSFIHTDVQAGCIKFKLWNTIFMLMFILLFEYYMGNLTSCNISIEKNHEICP